MCLKSFTSSVRSRRMMRSQLLIMNTYRNGRHDTSRSRFRVPAVRNSSQRTTKTLDNVKVKLFLCLTKYHTMKKYWGSGGVAPRIDFGATWRRAVSFTPRPLYPRDQSDRRVGGPQNRSGSSGEEKRSYHCSWWYLEPMVQSVT